MGVCGGFSHAVWGLQISTQPLTVACEFLLFLYMYLQTHIENTHTHILHYYIHTYKITNTFVDTLKLCLVLHFALEIYILTYCQVFLARSSVFRLVEMIKF